MRIVHSLLLLHVNIKRLVYSLSEFDGIVTIRMLGQTAALGAM